MPQKAKGSEPSFVFSLLSDDAEAEPPPARAAKTISVPAVFISIILQTSIKIRAGISIVSFTRRKNSTASRPSTMRWS